MVVMSHTTTTVSVVSRAVRLLSSLHAARNGLRNGQTSIDDVMKATIFSKQHFPKFLIVSMTMSGYLGFSFMESFRNSRPDSLFEVRDVISLDIKSFCAS